MTTTKVDAILERAEAARNYIETVREIQRIPSADCDDIEKRALLHMACTVFCGQYPHEAGVGEHMARADREAKYAIKREREVLENAANATATMPAKANPSVVGFVAGVNDRGAKLRDHRLALARIAEDEAFAARKRGDDATADNLRDHAAILRRLAGK